MKLTRRGFLTAAASSLIVAPELLREGLLDVDRTFFLPGPNGWIQPLARMVVPTRDIWMWEAGIAAGAIHPRPGDGDAVAVASQRTAIGIEDSGKGGIDFD